MRVTVLVALTACALCGDAVAQQQVDDPELTDAISREITVTNNLYRDDLVELTDAISREITVTNNLYRDDLVELTDAISREITVANDTINPVRLVDAISREMTVFNDIEGVDPDFDGVYSDDGDGTYDPCPTGVTVDCDDNCAATPNPDQRDGNANGQGDVCDVPETMDVLPGDNAVDAPLWTDVTLTFSEPVDPATVGDTDGDGTPDTLRLIKDGVPVDGSMTVSSDGLHAVFDPLPRLDAFTVYAVEVTTGVTDLDGHPLSEPFTSTFETGDDRPNEEELSDAPTKPQGEQSGEEHGRSIAPAGDVDGDGTDDWLVGAPGWDSASETDAGRVLLFLGTIDVAEREQADVIFEGARTFGRVGTSVDGGSDIDGDGTPDLVIGAEDWDGSAATGPGRAYVVFFDAADFPNLGDPSMPDVVDLATVADVELIGRATGDRAGRSVSLADDLDGDGRADVVIGAPGADRDGTADRGEVYAVHRVFALTSPADLGQVGAHGGIDGTTYLGEAAGDRLGWSVSAGEDFDCDGTSDLAAGAPQHAPSLGGGPPSLQAGAAYVDLEAHRRGITEIGKIGGGTTRSGLRLYGDLDGGNLGYSVALAADTNGDRCAEVLAGAPGLDVLGGTPGEIALLYGGEYGPNGPGVVDLAELRATTNGFGAVFVGTNDGDELGYAVASAGDVNEDGLGDLILGAPGADAQNPARLDAGVSYIDYGVFGDLTRGITEIGKIGGTRPGVAYFGESAGDRSGSAVAGIGDVDADGDDDVAVGAPERDVASETDAGQSYVVTEDPQPVPDAPPACPTTGCTVTDLDSGAQLETFDGTLAEPTSLNVSELLEPAYLPAPPPAGTTLVGATRVLPEAQSFDPPLPDLHVAVRSELEDQLTPGEGFDVYRYDGVDWADTTYDGGVVTNPRFGTRLAVLTTVETGGLFAVFFADADGDGTRDAQDGDRDGDGVENVVDNCPDAANAYQWDGDGDGVGDACDPDTVDSDGDTRGDTWDNCPSTPNEAQIDGDGDAIGDACDVCPEENPNDADGDGLCSGSPDFDNCRDVSNESQKDSDGDGVGDACDTNPVLTVSNEPLTDADADFETIQAAVDAVEQSGTKIAIYATGTPYAESVTVDRGLLMSFTSVEMPESDGPTRAIVDGGSSPAFTLVSSSGVSPIALRDLELRGAIGVDASVPSTLVGGRAESISDAALVLRDGWHEVLDLETGSNLRSAARVESAAELTMLRTRLQNATGPGFEIDGAASLTSLVLVDGADVGLRVGATGSLTLEASTIANNTGAEIDATSGGAVTISDSIVWDVGTGDLPGVPCTSITRSDVGDPSCDGVNGNLNADPLFDAGYALQDGSPCLDFGRRVADYDDDPCTDAEGGPRLEDYDGDGTVAQDLGALERRNASLVPQAVTGVRWLDATTLAWDPASGADTYAVYRTDASLLDYEHAWPCHANDLTTTQWTEPETPPEGMVWSYVISAESSREGTLGYGRCAERTNWTPCP